MTITKTINNQSRDTKILVSRDGVVWLPRYLSVISIDMNGDVTIYAYLQGRDSYTSQEILNPNMRDEKWEYAELYSYFNKE